jgi:membrane associated rhomboid family serine protease
MRSFARTAELQATILIVCVGLAWGVELVDRAAFGGSLDRFGIQPRTVDGVWGILAAPLLHGSWAHLAANTLPFLVLGWLVMLRRLRDFFVVTALVIAFGGLGVWLIGAPNTIHIGASSVLFGYVGYLLARGYFERSMGSIVLAVLVAAVYGSVLWGILPSQPGVSWEGHFAGFVSGVGAGKVLSSSPSAARVTRMPSRAR